MATAVDGMAEDVSPVGSLEERRALLARRRRALGLREWSTLLALAAIGLWLAVLVALSVLNG